MLCWKRSWEESHWMLLLNNETFHSSLWTMNAKLSTSVHSGPTGQQKWLISNKGASPKEQLHLIREEQRFEDYICKRKERNRQRVCLHTRCQLPNLVTLRRTNSHSSVIVPPPSSFHHPALLLLLASSQEEATMDPMWPEAKERSESLPLPRDSTDLCSYFP